MSLLPGQILPQSAPFGTFSPVTGKVTIEKNWWLFLYNIAQQVLSGGQGAALPADALIDLASADLDAVDADAIVLRRGIANALVQPPDVAPSMSEYPDIARALLLAQDGLLSDPPVQAQPAQSITLTGSPMTIRAPFNGAYWVSGSTVSALTVTRQGTAIATGIIAGAIPVSRLDQLTITYTGTPIVSFLPT